MGKHSGATASMGRTSLIISRLRIVLGAVSTYVQDEWVEWTHFVVVAVDGAIADAGFARVSGTAAAVAGKELVGGTVVCNCVVGTSCGASWPAVEIATGMPGRVVAGREAIGTAAGSCVVETVCAVCGMSVPAMGTTIGIVGRVPVCRDARGIGTMETGAMGTAGVCSVATDSTMGTDNAGLVVGRDPAAGAVEVVVEGTAESASGTG